MAGARAGTEVKRPAWNTSGSLGWLARAPPGRPAAGGRPPCDSGRGRRPGCGQRRRWRPRPPASRAPSRRRTCPAPPDRRTRANASCPLARMLIAKCALSRNTARLGERFTRLHSTSGGSSDSEAKELMVSPTLRPSVARRDDGHAGRIAAQQVAQRPGARSTLPQAAQAGLHGISGRPGACSCWVPHARAVRRRAPRPGGASSSPASAASLHQGSSWADD